MNDKAYKLSVESIKLNSACHLGRKPANWASKKPKTGKISKKAFKDGDLMELTHMQKEVRIQPKEAKEQYKMNSLYCFVSVSLLASQFLCFFEDSLYQILILSENVSLAPEKKQLE